MLTYVFMLSSTCFPKSPCPLPLSVSPLLCCCLCAGLQASQEISFHSGCLCNKTHTIGFMVHGLQGSLSPAQPGLTWVLLPCRARPGVSVLLCWRGATVGLLPAVPVEMPCHLVISQLLFPFDVTDGDFCLTEPAGHCST